VFQNSVNIEPDGIAGRETFTELQKMLDGNKEKPVVPKADTVKKVKVKTAIQDLNYIQVLSGINEGEQVVTGPYSLVSKTLKEGDKIQKTDKDKIFDDKKKD
jgi:multidrug efflux pump subunit AcrA (membrane-fusion protein)